MTEIPHGLWEPVAIVDFTNFNKEIEYYPDVKTDKKYNPSLRLYFYNATEKQEIMEVIDQEKIYSWCVPKYFYETKKTHYSHFSVLYKQWDIYGGCKKLLFSLREIIKRVF